MCLVLVVMYVVINHFGKVYREKYTMLKPGATCMFTMIKLDTYI